MRYRYSGQITLETAIVMPIIMIVVATFMCIALYIHDVVTIKSYGYSLAMEYRDCSFEEFTKNIKSQITKAPLFVTGTDVKVLNKSGQYKVCVYPKNKDKTGRLSMFFEKDKSITVSIEKKLNIEAMYAVRAIYDKLE